MSKQADLTVGPERVAAIFFKAFDEAGHLLDSSARLGNKPLVFLFGAGNVMPGLEKLLEGKRKDDFVSGTVPAEEAYGVRREELVQVMERKALNVDTELQVGMQLSGTDEQGRKFVASITAIEGESVTLDRNHPMVDQPVRFEVTVAGVRPAKPEEITHGHPHGPGGHAH